MRIIISVSLVLLLVFCCTAAHAKGAKDRIILLIAEQNIEGPQRAWWASEIDLSVAEATIAQRLIGQGYVVAEPHSLKNVIRQNRAFRLIDISEGDSVKLGNLSYADYIVLGKAIASAGANVPQSKMRACFANISAKLIRVQDGKTAAYFNTTGNSAHMDVISGGTEALVNAASDLAARVIDVLSRDGGN